MSSVILIACFFAFSVTCCQGTSWSYSNVNSWSTVHATNCGGSSQSPINLDTSVTQYLASLAADPFVFTNFHKTTGVTWTLTNDGHGAKVTLTGDTKLDVSGASLENTHRVEQFHFHWGSVNTQGSEHTLDGAQYPMELHIVTYNTKYADFSTAAGNSDGLAVLGFFFEISASDNSVLASLVTSLSSVTTSAQTTSATPFALDTLIPSSASFFRYQGGLTTPTCDEVVTWSVFRETIKISSTQLAAFRALQDSSNNAIEDNYRPVQALNSRTIYSSSASGVMAASLLVIAASALAVYRGILQ